MPGSRFLLQVLVFALQLHASGSRKISSLLNPARLGGGIYWNVLGPFFLKTWSLGQAPGIHREVLNPLWPPTATRRSRGAASFRTWGCW